MRAAMDRYKIALRALRGKLVKRVPSAERSRSSEKLATRRPALSTRRSSRTPYPACSTCGSKPIASMRSYPLPQKSMI
jgi:hypothetical protein